MQIENWTEIHDLADFIELSGADVENIKEAWSILSPKIASILNDFYDNRIMSDEKWRLKDICVETLKRKQEAYWSVLFSGVLDDVYRSHARSIAVKHHQHGVTMTDYIASYGWFLNAFERVLQCSPISPKERSAMMASVRRMVFLDMTIAASTYYIVYID
ncbi:protoglobin domain-containing protein [Stappia sp. ES.058]|uniref:protoglobin domain-containing protein n=1 Tax=Stappia sp. ES.058 TaxID=1881061 RepID=UPI000879BDBE|nr:protoglobin domain-containing protein [Stappia sp. ES.058]SDT94616.1 Protoglobin [Stappia sp. ES.058]